MNGGGKYTVLWCKHCRVRLSLEKATVDRHVTFSVQHRREAAKLAGLADDGKEETRSNMTATF